MQDKSMDYYDLQVIIICRSESMSEENSDTPLATSTLIQQLHKSTSNSKFRQPTVAELAGLSIKIKDLDPLRYI
jgi:hypothetical protein